MTRAHRSLLAAARRFAVAESTRESIYGSDRAKTLALAEEKEAEAALVEAARRLVKEGES